MLATTKPDPVVLVVDDDAEMRAYIRECLDVLSVRVEEAVDGREALERLRATPAGTVALVIVDVFMPGLDGRTLKSRLRADPRWARVPVLFITGEALRVRDGPVLRKPFNARTLLATVQPLLPSP